MVKAVPEPITTIALVGSPNVGKSVVFNSLTGSYVTVSNYPGTTVEVASGTGVIRGQEYLVIDTPGIYSLLPISAEELVTRDFLLRERPGLVVHVVDAKNLSRHLPLTLQLLEAGLKVILQLNIIDEASSLGLAIDDGWLQEHLGIPVVPTVAVSGQGMGRLRREIAAALDYWQSPRVQGGSGCDRCRERKAVGHGQGQQGAGAAPLSSIYPSHIVEAVHEVIGLTGQTLALHDGCEEDQGALWAQALLLLQGDEALVDIVRRSDPRAARLLRSLTGKLEDHFGGALPLVIAVERQAWANDVCRRSVFEVKEPRRRLVDTWGRRLTRVWPGLPIALLIMYLVFYRFVGTFGAGTLVDWLDTVFTAQVNPLVEEILGKALPWPLVFRLLGGEYGIITLGFRYALAIVLPIVGTFFLAFALLEDSGYLPRLSLLVNRACQVLGLTGRSAIPLVLGLGCGTMATITTRTLETRRERLIATFLLALAVPCSAQLGLIMALLAPYPGVLLGWALCVFAVMIGAGSLASRLIPGPRASFYMEVPPLRMPRPGNVIGKTAARVSWYLKEVLPLFVGASVALWIGSETGLFQAAVKGLAPVTAALGLPEEVGAVLIYGFFRRDYGAAGLYDMAPIMSPPQLLIAAVTLTLFVPCIAQAAVNVKEQGWLRAALMISFIFPFAIASGIALHFLMVFSGIM